MSNIRIRNVPEELRRKPKARVASTGLSLSNYLLREIKSVADRPTMEEFIERLKKQSKVRLSANVADIIREERGDR